MNASSTTGDRWIRVSRTTRLIAALSLVVAAALWGGPEASAGDRPRVVPVPDGFQPEGIAARGDSFFVGSIPTGAIYAGDLRTGRGSILVPGADGRSAIGLSLRGKALFVAGGETGTASVHDVRTGDELATFQLTDEGTFVNDVVATQHAAYFTDSVNPVIYKVPFDHGGTFGEPETIPLSGDIVYEEGFNANGIDATRNGKSLVLIQANAGELFEVDSTTGVGTEIDLGGETLVNGDGILLDRGHRLWVVQNADNLLTLVRLDRRLASGEVVARVSDDSFDVPTTVARAGSRLALVNARFGIEDPETAEYWVTQLDPRFGAGPAGAFDGPGRR